MARPRKLTHEREPLGVRWRHFNPEGCTLCGSHLHTASECRKIDDSLPAAQVLHPPVPVPVRVLPPGFSYLALREAPKRPTTLAIGQVWTSASGLVYYVDRLRGGFVTLMRYGLGDKQRIVLRTRLRSEKMLRDKSWRFVRQGKPQPLLSLKGERGDA